MKANRKLLELAMARACMTTAQLAEAAQMPRATVNGVISGKGASPAILGRVARALGVDVETIMEKED